MKKILTLVLASAMAVLLAAQEDQTTSEENDGVLKSKKGYVILQETGDMAFGIDAMPFINFAGNFFGAAGAGTVLWDFPQNDNVFFMKKFISPTEAYRTKMRIGHTQTSSKYSVTDDNAVLSNPLYDPALDNATDTRKMSNTNITIMGGKEMRRGHGRLQGFMGAELGLFYTRTSAKYDYSNSFSAINTNPSEGIAATPSVGSVNLTDERLLKTSSYTFGILGDIFVGAEYFFAPKMSIGGEFYWGIQYTALGKTKEEAEGWNGTTNAKVSNTYEANNNPNTLTIDNNNMGGKLYLLFHF
jgi:hypothetical protein